MLKMRVRLNRSFLVNYIGDTLHLLLLIVAFVAGPFSSGYFRRGIEIAALEFSGPAVPLNVGDSLTPVTSPATTPGSTMPTLTSAAAEAASRGTVHATFTANVQATRAATTATPTITPTATLSANGSNSNRSWTHGNDANEIDGVDFGRTRHMASHAISTSMDYLQQQEQHQQHHQQRLHRQQQPQPQPHEEEHEHQHQHQRQHQHQPLSSLSLQSPNATSPSFSLSLSSSSSSMDGAVAKSRSNSIRSGATGAAGGGVGGAGGYPMDGTYRHQIGSQRIALKMPTAPALSTNASSSGSGSGSDGRGRRTNTNARTSAKKVDTKYMLPKPQKTDAPMLNYIFDTFSTNKHHHHDQRYGPHFEDVQRLGQPTNITVQAGSSVHLNCRISLLQDKTVSWVRRNGLGSDDSALDLLTVGLHRYTGKERYQLEFQYPNNWRLKIANVKKDDEALYECQISTHPPRVIQINLHVNAPKVMIVDEFCDPLQEKYYEIDSTLQLACLVRNVAMTTSVVYWKHGDDVLNYDVTRGGISVKTELMEDGANSTLSIAKINKADSGNYTCSISDFQNFSIVVHILNGESFAELHHGGAAVTYMGAQQTLALNAAVVLLLLLCLPAYTHR